MLVITEKIPAANNWQGELALPFELRQKTRLRTRLSDGREVGLFLERGQVHILELVDVEAPLACLVLAELGEIGLRLVAAGHHAAVDGEVRSARTEGIIGNKRHQRAVFRRSDQWHIWL